MSWSSKNTTTSFPPFTPLVYPDVHLVLAVAIVPAVITSIQNVTALSVGAGVGLQ